MIESKQVINLTKKLISVETTNGKSLAGAKILKQFFDDNGLKSTVNEYSPGEGNIIVKVGPIENGAFLLSGHIDTVPFGDLSKWIHHPLSAHEEQGYIWGRGSVDMKAGTAVLANLMVEASRVEDQFKKGLIFAGSGQEEVGLLGAKALVEDGIMLNVEQVLIAEPTSLNSIIYEKGILWLEVECFGVQSHGSRPELGKNAIEGLALILDDLKKLLPTLENEAVGRTSINFGMISGGSAPNVVPDYAKLTCDIRTTPGVSTQEIIRIFTNYFDEIQNGFTYKLNVLQSEESLETSSTVLANIILEETKMRVSKASSIKMTGTYFGTDGAIFIDKKNVPFVIYGPGSTELLHQTNEKVSIEEISIAYESIWQSILKYCT